MAVRKRVESSFVAFDVTYVDGTRSSNRAEHRAGRIGWG